MGDDAGDGAAHDAPSASAEATYDPLLFDFLEADPKLLATQMALVDFGLFARIQRAELASLAWTRPDRLERAPNVVAFTLRFNNMTLWTSHEILQSTNIRRRADKIAHFIQVAKACLDINNFYGLKSILAGLQSTPVHRLSKTWALLGRRDKATFDKLCEVMSSENNSEKYRRRLASSKPPCIPFLGLHLSDLTFLHEAARSGAGADKVDREQQVSEMLDYIASLQYVPYTYKAIGGVAEFLSTHKFIAELQPFYEEENYRVSLLLEPKELPKDTAGRDLASSSSTSILSSHAPALGQMQASAPSSSAALPWPLSMVAPRIAGPGAGEGFPGDRSPENHSVGSPEPEPSPPDDQQQRAAPTQSPLADRRRLSPSTIQTRKTSVGRTISLPSPTSPSDASRDSRAITTDDLPLKKPVSASDSQILVPVVLHSADTPVLGPSAAAPPPHFQPLSAPMSSADAALAKSRMRSRGLNIFTGPTSLSTLGLGGPGSGAPPTDSSTAATAGSTPTAGSASISSSSSSSATAGASSVPPSTATSSSTASTSTAARANDYIVKRSSWGFMRKDKDGDLSAATTPLTGGAPNVSMSPATQLQPKRPHRRMISLIDDSIIDDMRDSSTPSVRTDLVVPTLSPPNDNDSDMEDNLSDDDDDTASSSYNDGVFLRTSDFTKIQGKLTRKDITENSNWRPVWAVLQPPYLLFFREKPKPGRMKPKSFVTVTEQSFVHAAHDYRKRKWVFRLIPSDGNELLFDAADELWLNDWIAQLSATIAEARQRRDDIMISTEAI